MSFQYLYSLEFNVDDYDLWSFPDDLRCPEDLPTIVRFTMDPSIQLEINEEEFFEQVNCDKKIVKEKTISLNERQVKNELNGRILVCKEECPGKAVTVGCFNFDKIQCYFGQLAEKFDSQWSNGRSGKRPCSEEVKQLVQLLNAKGQPSGLVFYTLRLTCFGPSLSRNKSNFFDSDTKENREELMCLERASVPCPCPSKSKVTGDEFDEYSAEINGSQLIVRVNKKDSRLVTRVFDSDIDRNGKEIKPDKNMVSVCGGDQQVDFKFSKGFSRKGFKTSSNVDCGQCPSLTEFQRKTSCVGKSFKNSYELPAIRGNLKYPGCFDDSSVKFNVFDKCNPCDATEKYRNQPQLTRGACFQVDEENINRELEGKCKLPKGIEVCRRGCHDPDTDVFILKIGSKKTNKQGRKNEIELEMRTPKAPDTEFKKKETREVQVEEKDFKTTCDPVKNDKPAVKINDKSAVKINDKSAVKGKQNNVKGVVKKKK